MIGGVEIRIVVWPHARCLECRINPGAKWKPVLLFELEASERARRVAFLALGCDTEDLQELTTEDLPTE